MNAQIPDPGAKARAGYYARSQSWAADVHGSLRTSTRIAWLVAAAAVVIAVLEAVALAALSPLKTVVPYTILVDRSTGYVETAKSLDTGKLTQDAAVTQAFLAQYVVARETFDATDLKENYRKVMLLSDGAARADYGHSMQRTTPSSPLNLYPATAMVSTTIKSVSLLSPTSALVRFDTARSDAGGPPVDPHAYAAVITFRYSTAPMRMDDRFTNPLGFQVTRYRRDEESLPGAQPMAAPATVKP